jgi:hypothetical protein
LRILHFLNQFVNDMGALGIAFVFGILFLTVQGRKEFSGCDKAGAGLANALVLTGDTFRAGAVAVAQKPPVGLLP